MQFSKPTKQWTASTSKQFSVIQKGSYFLYTICLLQHEDAKMYYLALELCLGTVYDFIEKDLRNKLPCDLTEDEIIRQTLKGIQHLHKINIGE